MERDARVVPSGIRLNKPGDEVSFEKSGFFVGRSNIVRRVLSVNVHKVAHQMEIKLQMRTIRCFCCGSGRFALGLCRLTQSRFSAAPTLLKEDS
jgi:hypothetical protein